VLVSIFEIPPNCCFRKQSSTETQSPNSISLQSTTTTTTKSMNIFRLIGDLLHLFSIVLLLYKIVKLGNARNISLKTQELYLWVFLTRYTDLFTSFYSYYNTIMKVCPVACIETMLKQNKTKHTDSNIMNWANTLSLNRYFSWFLHLQLSIT
jgi:hypothetical protein